MTFYLQLTTQTNIYIIILGFKSVRIVSNIDFNYVIYNNIEGYEFPLYLFACSKKAHLSIVKNGYYLILQC